MIYLGLIKSSAFIQPTKKENVPNDKERHALNHLYNN